VLRQATRWPRLFLVGDPRLSKWPGRRRWTQDWGFVPVRQIVAVKRRPLSDAERTRYDHDPGYYRTLCGNRCRQAWAGGGSGGQRSGDHNPVVCSHDACFERSARLAARSRLHDGCKGEHRTRKPHPKKGEKTDFRDAVDLAVHHRHGLLTGSFLPERGIVELRDLTRRRKKLLGNPGSEKNRIQKLLDPAGVKMGNVVSDVFGVSGQQILRSLPDKEALSAEQMADLAKKRLRNRIPELTEALRDQPPERSSPLAHPAELEHAQFLDVPVESLEKKSTGTWSGTEGSTNCCRRYRVLKKPQRPVFWRKSERV